MTRSTIYFAHPICDYGTPKEANIVVYLRSLGYKVINPAKFQIAYDDWLRSPQFTGDNKMQFWVELAQSCDAIAFCSFDSDLEAEGVPSGYQDTTGSAFRNRPTIRIGAGVWKEVNSFLEQGKEALFVDQHPIPGAGVHVDHRVMTEWLDCFTLLSVDETKALLRASGRYSG